MTFSPVSLAPGCTYCPFDFCAILSKHLENVWRIRFYLILSLKGHWSCRISPHSLNSVSGSSSHQSFTAKMRVYFERLGCWFLHFFFLWVRTARTQKRFEHHWLVWCWVCKGGVALSQWSFYVREDDLIVYYGHVSLQETRGLAEFTLACGCRWEGWIHRMTIQSSCLPRSLPFLQSIFLPHGNPLGSSRASV